MNMEQQEIYAGHTAAVTKQLWWICIPAAQYYKG